VDFYLTRNPADPDWLAQAALFHGHLGPWLVLGAMIGRDAVARLDTPGFWKIDVVCWLPADRHRTPFSCILDGLQTGCGATAGKCNLRMEASEEVLARGWPVVHVIRLPAADRPAAGIAYAGTAALHDVLRRVTPENLEEISRRLAADDVARLFDIAPMSPLEMTLCGHGPDNQSPRRPVGGH